MREFLQPTFFIDSDNPLVVSFAEQHRGDSPDPRQQAISLYLAVHDEIRYNPYAFSADRQTLKGSHALLAGESYCVPKALLLAACARHCDIPARIGLAVFAMHGYTELFLEGRWVKATPAFNLELCRLFNVEPLEFDGLSDSVFHPYNQEGERYMEYLVDHGQFAELPEELFFRHLQTVYPHLFVSGAAFLSGDLHSEMTD